MPFARSRNLPGQSLTEQAFAGLYAFALKTLFPLIPIAFLFFLAVLIINAEITGVYKGSTPYTGAISLDLKEENESLSGTLLLKRNKFYRIVSGKMLGENELELLLSEGGAGGINALNKTAVEMQLPVIPDESELAESSAEELNTEKESVLPHVKIRAKKDFDDLTGTMEIDSKSLSISLHRNAFSSFFGRRWINRALHYFGIKT